MCAAILQQAVKDYQTALMKKDTDKAAYFEQWFRDDWAQLISGDMGEIIIQKCRNRAVTGGRPNRLANKVAYRKTSDAK